MSRRTCAISNGTLGAKLLSELHSIYPVHPANHPPHSGNGGAGAGEGALTAEALDQLSGGGGGGGGGGGSSDAMAAFDQPGVDWAICGLALPENLMSGGDDEAVYAALGCTAHVLTMVSQSANQ